MKLYSLPGLVASGLVALSGLAESGHTPPGVIADENRSPALFSTDARYLRNLDRLVHRTANKRLTDHVPYPLVRFGELARQVVQDMVGPPRVRPESQDDDGQCRDTGKQTLSEPEEFMQSRLTLWQRRFGLEHWTISVRLVPRLQLAPGTLGDVTWTQHNATIRALDPSDYDLAPCRIVADLEETIVHELIHLFLAESITRNESLKAEENRVNHITKALLEMNPQPASKADSRVEALRASNRATPKR